MMSQHTATPNIGFGAQRDQITAGKPLSSPVWLVVGSALAAKDSKFPSQTLWRQLPLLRQHNGTDPGTAT